MYKVNILYKNRYQEEIVIYTNIDRLESALLNGQLAITIRTPKGFVYINLEEVVCLEVKESDE